MSDQKNISYAVGMHICGMLGWFILPVIHIIIMHVVNASKEKDSFADHHGREAIRFQWMMLFYSIIIFVPFIVIALFTMGVSLGGGPDASEFAFFTFLSLVWSSVLVFWLPLLMVVLPVRAAMKASDGLPYAYPFIFSPRRKAWNEYKYANKPAQNHHLP